MLLTSGQFVYNQVLLYFCLVDPQAIPKAVTHQQPKNAFVGLCAVNSEKSGQYRGLSGDI